MLSTDTTELHEKPSDLSQPIIILTLQGYQYLYAIFKVLNKLEKAQPFQIERGFLAVTTPTKLLESPFLFEMVELFVAYSTL